MTMRNLILIAAALALVAAPLAADTPITTGIWYEFHFSGTGEVLGCSPAGSGGGCVPSSGTSTVFVGDPLWTFTSAAPVSLVVTDAFIYGDVFEVFDGGSPIGSTPLVGLDQGDCGDDPVACLADPLSSHGLFLLGPGDHSISMRMPQIYSAGAAYFTLQPVPEPASVGLLALTLGLVAIRARR